MSLSWLKLKQKRSEEATKLRTQAIRLLDVMKANTSPMESGTYHLLMAQVLNNLDENRRAIPFWERAIRLLATTSLT